MTLREIESPNAPEAIGPYSQAILADGWLYCSGQIALDPTSGDLLEGGVAEQTEQVLANLAAVLEEAGATLSYVVKTTVYLSDMGIFTSMNQVYGEHFDAHPPARATVEVSALPRGVAVEIDAVAFLG